MEQLFLMQGHEGIKTEAGGSRNEKDCLFQGCLVGQVKWRDPDLVP